MGKRGGSTETSRPRLLVCALKRHRRGKPATAPLRGAELEKPFHCGRKCSVSKIMRCVCAQCFVGDKSNTRPRANRSTHYPHLRYLYACSWVARRTCIPIIEISNGFHCVCCTCCVMCRLAGSLISLTKTNRSTDRRLPVLLGHIVVLVNISVCNSGFGYVL